MNTNNDKTVFLASSDDWESWDLQFKAQAVAAGIWSQVQGVTPLLEEPTAPNPADHKHKAPSQPTITARVSTESMTGDDDSGPANPQTNNPITIADLTTDGFRTFQMTWTVYQAAKKDYVQQTERVERLKQWMLKTISTHYQRTSCKPTNSIQDWYTALKTQAGTSDDDTIDDAREAYQLAVKPLHRVPKDLIKWSEQWEHAVSTAQDKGVGEALRIKSWFTDFINAVQPIMGSWITSYEMLQRPSIKQLTLTYREVAHDFRKEVRRQTKARVPAGNRVAKGSFGPSFAATKDGKKAYQEDASDSEIEPGSDGGEQINGRKRRGGSGPKDGERLSKRPRAVGTANLPEGKRPKQRPKKVSGTASTTCPCCGQFHRLEKCYYAFPDLAPDGFVEREHVRMRAKEALTDPDLQEEVEKLKNQRRGSQ